MTTSRVIEGVFNEYNPPLVKKSFYQFILVCVSSQKVMMMKTEESGYTTGDI